MFHNFKIKILACFLVMGIASSNTTPVSAMKSISGVTNVLKAAPSAFLKMGTNLKSNTPFLLKRIVFFSLILLVGVSIDPEQAKLNRTLGKNDSLGGAMYSLLGLATLFLHLPFASAFVGSNVKLFVSSIAGCFQLVGCSWFAEKVRVWVPYLLKWFLKVLTVALCVAPAMDGLENKCGSIMENICTRLPVFLRNIFCRRCSIA